jgi:hypothetical protein
MKAREMSKNLPASPVSVDGADQANSNAQSAPGSFLPGRAGAGLENLVQVAEFGSSRQL